MVSVVAVPETLPDALPLAVPLGVVVALADEPGVVAVVVSVDAVVVGGGVVAVVVDGVVVVVLEVVAVSRGRSHAASPEARAMMAIAGISFFMVSPSV